MLVLFETAPRGLLEGLCTRPVITPKRLNLEPVQRERVEPRAEVL